MGWVSKVWLWRVLQTDLGLAVLSGLEIITLWTVGFKGCTTFGPTSLTSDHTIAHLPSFPRSICIKRSIIIADFILLLSIPFIVEKIFPLSCPLSLNTFLAGITVIIVEISRIWILNKCNFILSFISSATTDAKVFEASPLGIPVVACLGPRDYGSIAFHKCKPKPLQPLPDFPFGTPIEPLRRPWMSSDINKKEL